MVQYLCAAYSLGGPLNLERDDYPWNVPFYPFPFTLEPLTPDSLAKYVYAECRTPSFNPRLTLFEQPGINGVEVIRTAVGAR